jgi:hypothetical protein
LKVIRSSRSTRASGEPRIRRPTDECPFRKPFDAEFSGCPAFQAMHLVVLNSQGKFLNTIWTCRQLDGKSIPGKPGSYYGACRLGDSEARMRWAETVGPDRIVAMNRLRSDVMPIAQGFLDALAVLKARQVEAIERKEDPADVRLGMEALGHNYLDELEAVLRQRMALLGQAQMPKRAVLQMANQWVVEVIEEIWGNPGGEPEFPDHLLAALPDSVRTLYAPPA